MLFSFSFFSNIIVLSFCWFSNFSVKAFNLLFTASFDDFN
jgi:hypothetical protein